MKKLSKFLNAINYEPSPQFGEGSFISNEIISDSNGKPVVHIILEFDNFLPIKDIVEYENKCNNYKYAIHTKYIVKSRGMDVDVLYDYLKHILDINDFLFGNSLRHNDLTIGKTLGIACHSKDSMNGWEKNKNVVISALADYGFNFDDMESSMSTADPWAEDDLKLRKKIDAYKQEQQSQKKIQEAHSTATKSRQIKTTSISLNEIDEMTIQQYEGSKVSFVAEVVSKPEIITRTDKNLIIVSLIFTDQTESIKGTFFHNITMDKNAERWKKTSFAMKDKLYNNYMKGIKAGQIVNVVGTLKINPRTNEIYIDVYDLQDSPNTFTTTDHEQIKRVEFHTHTKMSSLDGVNTASDYVKKAIEWGHDAIAITDHDSLQAYPEAYNTIRWNKDNKFKLIYGVEMSVIDQDKKYIIDNYNEKIDLENDTYVFFDLETTGLSARYNEIIEFGAVKVKNNKAIEKKQMFIKPEKPIPDFITEITSITNDTVADSKKLSEVIKEIKDWIGDAILVAHNADFDISFLNAAYSQNGLELVNNPVIDTMRLSWTIHTTRNHRLGTLAKYYNVAYDAAVAHRADYDAEVLSAVYFNIQNRLESEERFSAKDMMEMSDVNIEKLFPFHATIYAKNQEGLKDLYELVSLAHTTYLGKTPRIPKFEIEKRKKNLIIGSACDKGEIFNQLAMNPYDVDNYVDFYDFFEVMPHDSFTNLIDKQILTRDEIVEVIQDIYALGQKHEKLVVATGNVHYLNPDDKKIREVLVYNKGLGGALHPLYDFKKRSENIPDNYFRTTKTMKESFEGVFKQEIIQDIVVKNSRTLMERFDFIKPIPDDLYPPQLNKDPGKKLTDLVYKNGELTYGPRDGWNSIIKERVERELGSIIKHGYAEIYLISAEIVQNSIDNGYLVGSRGSVGSSIVATFSNITEVNPLPPHYYCQNCNHTEFNNDYDCGYDLPDKICSKCNEPFRKEGHDIPFETFLGFEGDKIPDIDLNFAREYQLRAHDYTRKMFGEDNVFRAGTISTLAGQTAYGFVMNWAEQKGVQDKISRSGLERLQQRLIGSKRTTGQHPGGLIVVPKEKSIYDFTPTNHPANDKKEHKTTHFDFHAIHDNLLKLDLLGHLDPSAIRMLQNLTGVDPIKIPHSDDKVLGLFNGLDSLGISSEQIAGETMGTIGVPEFGTKFVREMLQDTKPKSFADLVRVSGLSHGTDVWLNNAKDLILSDVITLKDAIACRDDIMVYLMKKGLPSKLSFDIMEKVRKGKGLSEGDEKEMRKHHVEDWYIDSCKAIKYMFPKAHATAYVLMAWRVAWFKIYYPLEYYATFFTTRCDFFDVVAMNKGPVSMNARLAELRARDNAKRGSGLEPLNVKEKGVITSLESTLELYARGYKVSKIDLQKSLAHEWILDKENKSLIPPFSTLEGMGETTAKGIEESRKNMPEGIFKTKEEFINNNKVNQTLLLLLEEYGLFEGIRDSNQLSIFDFE